jgi:hypothetical protein
VALLRRNVLLAATLLAALVALASSGTATAGNGGVCFECEPAAGGPDPADGVLSLRELRALTRDVGFVRPRVAAAIAMAESSGRVRAVGRNRKPRSIDRGLFQINSRWHLEVSNACAFDARCNAEAAYRISEGGRDWDQWTTWHSGAYRAYL